VAIVTLLPGICVALGLAIVNVSSPAILAAVAALVVLAAVIALLASLRLILMLLLVAVPSAPVGVQIWGHDFGELRTAAMTAVVASLALVHRHMLRERLSGRVLVACMALAALVPIGIAASGDTSHGSLDLLKSFSQAVGQPFSYAILLGAFGLVLRERFENETALLGAWGVALLIQAAVCAGQFATGSAFDRTLGYDRANGTMGADFLGAFALLSVFAALHARAASSNPRDRRIATIAVVVAALTVVVSLSRGALIGLAVGLLALLLRALRTDGRRARTRPVLIVFTVLAAGLFLTRGIWSARLTNSLTEGFDRPATWVSGLRIAADHPWTGVGASHVADVVNSTLRYSYTPYGHTVANPHDTWIFAMAAEGFPYGIVLLCATGVFAWVLLSNPRVDGCEYLGAGLLGTLLVFGVNNLFTHPDNMIFVLLAIAMILVRKQGLVAGGSRPPP
jgi:O-antigen ligase